MERDAGEQKSMSKEKEDRALRKQRAKESKRQRRLKREGKAGSEDGNKDCEKCGKSSQVLIRCQYDETKLWRLVCGTCWREVSGGVPDGRGEEFPFYRYGGLWKNRTIKK